LKQFPFNGKKKALAALVMALAVHYQKPKPGNTACWCIPWISGARPITWITNTQSPHAVRAESRDHAVKYAQARWPGSCGGSSMTDLSPAAQAVMDAALEHSGPAFEPLVRKMVTDALRALAVRINGADAIRQDILDIADELNSQ
jgi:hypothetical protein